MTDSQKKEVLTEDEVVQKYKSLRQSQQTLSQQIGKFEGEFHEHGYTWLVISEVEAVEKTRKCFRLVAGVLIERKAEEILKDVKTNREGIEKILEELGKQLTHINTELQAHIVKYNIRKQASGENPNAPLGDGGPPGLLA